MLSATDPRVHLDTVPAVGELAAVVGEEPAAVPAGPGVWEPLAERAV
jgi:hypothetical protein